MKKYVVIVAGGKGLRMGGDLPKQFIPIGGKPVLMYTLEAFYAYDHEMELILVLPLSQQEYWKLLCKEYSCKIIHQVIDGGETRFHSVQNGLSQIEEPGLVAIHDGVRPFVSKDVIDMAFSAALKFGAAIPVLEMTDSIRQISSSGKNTAVDRNLYRSVQTPQVFDSSLILAAYKQSYTETFTDDASVVEAVGHSIQLVPGNKENIKITTPFDLQIAEIIVKNR